MSLFDYSRICKKLGTLTVGHACRMAQRTLTIPAVLRTVYEGAHEKAPPSGTATASL
jgi:hypothetical protein